MVTFVMPLNRMRLETNTCLVVELNAGDKRVTLLVPDFCLSLLMQKNTALELCASVHSSSFLVRCSWDRVGLSFCDVHQFSAFSYTTRLR